MSAQMQQATYKDREDRTILTLSKQLSAMDRAGLLKARENILERIASAESELATESAELEKLRLAADRANKRAAAAGTRKARRENELAVLRTALEDALGPVVGERQES